MTRPKQLKSQSSKSLVSIRSDIETKEPGVMRGAVLSDLHLGTERNPTSEKIQKIRAATIDSPSFDRLDYLFFAGDTYDSNLNHSSEVVIEIDIWIADTLRACVKHNVALRVLLGTRSHDHNQPRRFTAINYLAEIGADIKYISDIDVMVEKGMSFLYIPDDVDRDTDKIYHRAKTMMMDKGLEQVDFAIMHGQFEYQLPAVVKAPKHNSKKYLDLVKHYIFIGHVHVRSTFERIIAQGSFDRDKHGEEKPKGHVEFEVNYNTEERRCKFIVNKNAKIFKTLKITQSDIEKVLEYVKAQITDRIPDGSFVRLMAPKNHPLHTNVASVARLFPMITFTANQAEEEKSEAVNLIDEVPTYQAIDITPENIVELVIEKAKTLTDDSGLLDECQRLLSVLK